jgi:hypothetical protein
MYPYIFGLIVGNSIIFAIHSCRMNDRYKKDIEEFLKQKSDLKIRNGSISGN